MKKSDTQRPRNKRKITAHILRYKTSWVISRSCTFPSLNPDKRAVVVGPANHQMPNVEPDSETNKSP